MLCCVHGGGKSEDVKGRKVRRKTLVPESRKTKGRRSELADEELSVLSECVPKEGASGRGTNKQMEYDCS
jgi:hypothetical protein